MYTFAGTAIAGLDCVDVHNMHVEYTHVDIHTRSDRLPSLCANGIDTRIRIPFSLVMDPLCYINLTFGKRPFAKLYNINLLGTFVGLAYCIQARV